MPKHPAWLGNQHGTAAVEFAILTPVFLLLLTGMLAYGLYFGAFHSLQQLAADAARTAISGLSETERNRLVTRYITSNGGSYPLVEQRHLAMRIGDKPGDTTQYQVTLSYDSTTLPIWNLYLPLPLPSRTIVVTSTIRRGGI